MAIETAKLREMEGAELDKEETALREQVWKLRLQGATGQLPDPHKVRRVRKDLARVLTIKRERARAAAGGAGR
jgi:large subunit ribosomal protein L29